MTIPEPDTRKQQVIRDTLIGVIGELSGASIETLYQGLGQAADGWADLDERAVFAFLEMAIKGALRKPEEPEPEPLQQRSETPPGVERRLFEIGGRRRRR